MPTDQLAHPVWTCLQQHLQYFTLLLQTSFSKADVRRIDQLIYSQQSIFLTIPQYHRCRAPLLPRASFCQTFKPSLPSGLCSLWKPKNHFAQHFPVDIMRYGPPVYYWCMKFEMRHQVRVALYAHTRTHTYTHARAHTRAHTHARTRTRTRARTHTRAHARTHARARAHARTHARAHTRAHTHAHARTHAHAHTRTRTHAHTHTKRTNVHWCTVYWCTRTHARTHAYAHAHTHTYITHTITVGITLQLPSVACAAPIPLCCTATPARAAHSPLTPALLPCAAHSGCVLLTLAVCGSAC